MLDSFYLYFFNLKYGKSFVSFIARSQTLFWIMFVSASRILPAGHFWSYYHEWPIHKKLFYRPENITNKKNCVVRLWVVINYINNCVLKKKKSFLKMMKYKKNSIFLTCFSNASTANYEWTINELKENNKNHQKSSRLTFPSSPKSIRRERISRKFVTRRYPIRFFWNCIDWYSIT